MLNPDKNLYSVAPVGHVVIIGRQGALKGGITRENALNLLTWLIIATDASPEEITAGIGDANRPTIRGGIVAPAEIAKPAIIAVPKVETPPVVAEFMGAVDEEEKKALDAALDPRQFDAAMKIPVVDEGAVGKKWGVR